MNQQQAKNKYGLHIGQGVTTLALRDAQQAFDRVELERLITKLISAQAALNEQERAKHNPIKGAL